MYLLDTHILLWWASGSDRLDNDVRNVLKKPTYPVYWSAASAWEIGVKIAIGKLECGPDLLQKARDNQLIDLPITAELALSVATMPLHHADPFDRLLVAQALERDLILITADDVLKKYDAEIMLNKA